MRILKNHIPFLLVILSIALVWVYRFSSLHDPYFWDEMGVYGNGVQYLLQHGISIFPNAMPPEISRGHPLLFYAVHASVLKLFGSSFFVSHAFALFLSSFCLLSTYLLAKEFVSKLMAAMAATLLASLNIFLAQSTLILPEMSVALLSTLALWAYFRKKYILLVFLLSLGVLIKESMIITAGFMGVVYVLHLLQTKTLKENLGKVFLFTIPLWVLLSFLLIQKIQNGWYFFPYHTDIVKDSALSGFFEKLEMHYNFIFYKQARNQWLILVLLATISLLFTATKRKTLILGSYFIYSLALFSFAFYMDRYLLFLYPVLLIFVVQGIYFLSGKHNFISIGIVSILLVLSISNLQDGKFRYDSSLAYQDVISVHMEAVSVLCEEDQTELLCWSNFPINMSLWDSRFGYITSSCQTKIHLVDDPSAANYVLLYNEDFKDQAFELLQKFDKNEADIKLYKKI